MNSNNPALRALILATAILSCFCTFQSCSSNSGSALPNVSGKAGEVLAVMEKSLWDGGSGKLLRDSLCADCPFLPVKEPLYNLVNVIPSNFSQMFRIHRNIILCKVDSSTDNEGISIKKDVWAHPQTVIYVNSTSIPRLDTMLAANMSTMMKAIEKAERDRVVANTLQYQETKLAHLTDDIVGGSLAFPSGWSLKKHTGSFVWVSYETTYIQQGIFIYSCPAERNSKELSAEAIVARRNEVLKENVPGMVDGSYMTTSDYMPPVVSYLSHDGLKFAQLRGLWDVHGDFMGGPFVSHSFYSRDSKSLICIEAYVYAPKYDKRHYLRQTEAILYTFKFAE